MSVGENLSLFSTCFPLPPSLSLTRLLSKCTLSLPHNTYKTLGMWQSCHSWPSRFLKFSFGSLSCTMGIIAGDFLGFSDLFFFWKMEDAFALSLKVSCEPSGRFTISFFSCFCIYSSSPLSGIFSFTTFQTPPRHTSVALTIR